MAPTLVLKLPGDIKIVVQSPPSMPLCLDTSLLHAAFAPLDSPSLRRKRRRRRAARSSSGSTQATNGGHPSEHSDGPVSHSARHDADTRNATGRDDIPKDPPTQHGQGSTASRVQVAWYPVLVPEAVVAQSGDARSVHQQGGASAYGSNESYCPTRELAVEQQSGGYVDIGGSSGNNLSVTAATSHDEGQEEEELLELSAAVRDADPLKHAKTIRDIGGKMFAGQVEEIVLGKVPKERLYCIRYCDGDTEHYTAAQVEMYMCRNAEQP